MQDLHSNIKISPALTPKAAIATDTTTVGLTISRKDFDSLEFLFISGVLTDGAYACHLYESDDSGMSGETLVVAADLIGSEPTFAATDDGVCKRLGYKGSKAYVRTKVVTTGTSSGGFLAAIALQGHARVAPVA